MKLNEMWKNSTKGTKLIIGVISVLIIGLIIVGSVSSFGGSQNNSFNTSEETQNIESNQNGESPF